MKMELAVACCFAFGLLMGLPAMAYHSFAADEFNVDKDHLAGK